MAMKGFEVKGMSDNDADDMKAPKAMKKPKSEKKGSKKGSKK